MWSLRTVATYVLLTMAAAAAAAAGLVPEATLDHDSLNDTVYYKPQSRRNFGQKVNITSIIDRSRNVENEERLSKMSSLNPNFWVYAHLPDRKPDPGWDYKSDCFYKSRNSMRWYPSVSTGRDYCYVMDFNPPRRNAWWNFWPEIRGDLQYAFDFVLWDEYEQYHETNSFWYLMLYLKTLVKHIKDPNMVATNARPGLRNESWRRALDPKAISEEHKPLLELLNEYETKLQHLESLI